MIAGIAALFVYFVLLKKEGFRTFEIIRLFFICAIFMIIGANLLSASFYFIANFSFASDNLLYIVKNFFNLGTMFFGALSGFILFLYFYIRPRFRKKNFNIADISVIGIALGQSIGRIGCFLSGCCYGKPTDLPWGVKFFQIGNAIHPFYDTPVHPTQIYESLLDFLNFSVLFFLYRKKKFDGQVFAFYLVNYGIIRFFMEYLRGDVYYLYKGEGLFLSITLFQVVSLFMVCFGIIILKNIKEISSFRELKMEPKRMS